MSIEIGDCLEVSGKNDVVTFRDMLYGLDTPIEKRIQIHDVRKVSAGHEVVSLLTLDEPLEGDSHRIAIKTSINPTSADNSMAYWKMLRRFQVPTWEWARYGRIEGHEYSVGFVTADATEKFDEVLTSGDKNLSARLQELPAVDKELLEGDLQQLVDTVREKCWFALEKGHWMSGLIDCGDKTIVKTWVGDLNEVPRKLTAKDMHQIAEDGDMSLHGMAKGHSTSNVRVLRDFLRPTLEALGVSMSDYEDLFNV